MGAMKELATQLDGEGIPYPLGAEVSLAVSNAHAQINRGGFYWVEMKGHNRIVSALMTPAEISRLGVHLLNVASLLGANLLKDTERSTLPPYA